MTTRITGRLKALTPVYHGGNEKTGSVVLLNRLKFIVDGEPTDVPIISGNQIRGRLRRLLARDFLNLTGYQLDLEKKADQKLYHTLFAGGVLTEVEESESAVVDLSLKSRVVKYILPVRLFGASYANQMVEGRVRVMHALPICKELVEYTGIPSNTSFYTLISRAFQTRRDELRAKREENEEAVQMLVEYECFAPGTEFYHELILDSSDPVDLATLYRAVKLWTEQPFIGGKSSVGFGRLNINYEWPSNASDQPYLDFVKNNKDEILKVIDELKQRL
ncbi:MAG: RAMP superfamily CRISPR-associated protein [Infirmifilum sp.]